MGEELNAPEAIEIMQDRESHADRGGCGWNYAEMDSGEKGALLRLLESGISIGITSLLLLAYAAAAHGSSGAFAGALAARSPYKKTSQGSGGGAREVISWRWFHG